MNQLSLHQVSVDHTSKLYPISAFYEENQRSLFILFRDDDKRLFYSVKKGTELLYPVSVRYDTYTDEQYSDLLKLTKRYRFVTLESDPHLTPIRLSRLRALLLAQIAANEAFLRFQAAHKVTHRPIGG
jgi:hypothetical protein